MIKRIKLLPNLCVTTLILLLTILPSFGATVSYEYDDQYRLTMVDYGNGIAEQYTYDVMGNRSTLTVTDTQPVRRAGVTPVYYFTLQEAYDASVNGDTIQARAVNLTGNLRVDRNIAVTLEGGYNSDFTSNTGATTSLKGSIQTLAGGGTLTIKNFILTNQ